MRFKPRFKFDRKPSFATNGGRVIWFIENYCTHTDGDLMGEPFLLEPWQKWLIYEMFRIDEATGLRYWREFLVMIPRGNGKSALASALGFYFLIFDDEGAPEVYSSAWGVEQARAVFEPAKLMWEASPNLQAVCDKYANAFTCPDNFGSWHIVSRIAETKQGKKPHALLNDELHIHRTGELRDAFIRGMHKRKQPIALDITTEGKSRTAPLGELQKGFYENGEREQIHSFLEKWSVGRSCMIRWGVPWDAEGWKADDPKVVRACNPLSVIDPDTLMRDQLHAPAKREADFVTYHLNGLVEVDEADGLPAALWDNCKDESLCLIDGQEVVVSLDVGYRSDNTAVLVGGYVGDRIVTRSWIWKPPRDSGQELDVWSTGVAQIERLLEQYTVTKIVADPALALGAMQLWQGRGIPVREFRFSWGEIAPASVRTLEAVQREVLAHDGDGELRAHVLNMRVRENGTGAWRFDKHTDHDRKNDAGIALCMLIDELVGGDSKPFADRGGLLII